jgi:hypothetical protein
VGGHSIALQGFGGSFRCDADASVPKALHPKQLNVQILFQPSHTGAQDPSTRLSGASMTQKLCPSVDEYGEALDKINGCSTASSDISQLI